MRTLDRLTLISTCLATTVVIFTTVPVVQQFLPRRETLFDFRRREQPVVQTVDLSRLTPQIRQAVEKAREQGLHQARLELDKLHARIMAKVDGAFLDWYFGYVTQQRMAWGYAFNKAASWVSGSDADKDLQEHIAREFGLRVIPAPVLDEELQRIARQSVAVFLTSLQDHLQSIPKQYEIPPAQWEAYLASISTMVSLTEGSRSVPLTLKAFAAGLVWSGTGVVASLAPAVTAQLARTAVVAGTTRATGVLTGAVARKALTTVGRQAAARGAAASAGSWGPVVGGAALLGLIVWEIWDHRSTVAENRPLLRNNIDHFLRLYEHSLVEPAGMIGTILHDLETRIVTNIVST
ncbi:hypothetical protein DC522_04870 [Microvirga sp. KLBC 81]|nr:hypothetical protein DC522_04870 [Microvirga sp. KLBC 81]